MTAYEIPSTLPSDPEANLPPLLTPFWQLRPVAVTFGRLVKMFHEGAIVSLYEGQIRFIRPDLDASEPNAHVIEKYNVSFTLHPWIRGVTHLSLQFEPPRPQSSQWPCLFAAQRIFWLSSLHNQKGTTCPWQMAIETTAVPENDHREGRAIMDFQESQSSSPSPRTRIVQDWDELSGRLCIRSVHSRFTQDLRCRRITWRVTLVDFV
jgi:hypothetical protein